MDEKMWKRTQKDMGFDDAEMTRFFGECGAQPTEEEIEELYEMLGSCGEGVPPDYFRLSHIDDKSKLVCITVGTDVEDWIFKYAKGGECKKVFGSSWEVPQQVFTMLQLKFGSANER